MVQYQFRKPKLPLLLASDTIVVGAMSDSEVKKWIKKLTFQEKSLYQVVDATAEGWSYYPEHNVITPLSIDKRWTKKKIIDFYNSSIKNEEDRQEYIVKSISKKKIKRNYRRDCALSRQTITRPGNLTSGICHQICLRKFWCKLPPAVADGVMLHNLPCTLNKLEQGLS